MVSLKLIPGCACFWEETSLYEIESAQVLKVLLIVGLQPTISPENFPVHSRNPLKHDGIGFCSQDRHFRSHGRTRLRVT